MNLFHRMYLDFTADDRIAWGNRFLVAQSTFYSWGNQHSKPKSTIMYEMYKECGIPMESWFEGERFQIRSFTRQLNSMRWECVDTQTAQNFKVVFRNDQLKRRKEGKGTTTETIGEGLSDNAPDSIGYGKAISVGD